LELTLKTLQVLQQISLMTGVSSDDIQALFAFQRIFVTIQCSQSASTTTSSTLLTLTL